MAHFKVRSVRLDIIMSYLITSVKLQLLFLVVYQSHAHDLDKRSLFSWPKDSASKGDNTVLSGYLPAIKVHKYNGIQINPTYGSPIYLSNVLSESSNANSLEQFPLERLPLEYIQQLDILNRIAAVLPEDESKLEEFDISFLLPYVELISEDSLRILQSSVERAKNNHNSKLLKLIACLRTIKKKKLAPFKFITQLGSNLINKKKEKVKTVFSHLGHVISKASTPAPHILTETSTLNIGYPFDYQTNSDSIILPLNIFSRIQEPTPSASVPVSYNQVQSYAADSNFYGVPTLPINPTKTSSETSNNIQTYKVGVLQNNVVTESTPSAGVQLLENQYSFPQYINEALTQPQSFAQFKYQLPTGFDNFSPSLANQVLKRDTEKADITSSSNPSTSQNHQADQLPAPIYHEGMEQKTKPENITYYQTPANTYVNSDLVNSASENVENKKEYSSSVSTTMRNENVKKVSEVVNNTQNLENYKDKLTTESSKPIVTKLRTVYVHPENKLNVSDHKPSEPSPSSSTPGEKMFVN